MYINFLIRIGRSQEWCGNMGWNINITLDKPITEKELDDLISNDLPDVMSRRGGGRQTWGWSLIVDVKLREETVIGLSGSYGLSGDFAELSAEVFARHLEKRGYNVVISEMH